MQYRPVQVRVKGKYACFNRPETPVERYSYDVATPSAAWGILKSIYWKPQMRWLVLSITNLAPVRRFEMTANEVGGIFRSTKTNLYVEDNRIQRQTNGLLDVDFIIEAYPMPIGYREDDVHNGVVKHAAIFNRRVEDGSPYVRPFFGQSQYVAEIYPVSGEEVIPIEYADKTIDHGNMFLGWGAYGKGFDNAGEPQFFHCLMKNGTYHVPLSFYGLEEENR